MCENFMKSFLSTQISVGSKLFLCGKKCCPVLGFFFLQKPYGSACSLSDCLNVLIKKTRMIYEVYIPKPDMAYLIASQMDNFVLLKLCYAILNFEIEL